MTIYNGTSGDNTINGSTGSDVLTGGRGDDSLNGGTGNDVYVFSKGDGLDTIQDYDTNLNTDTVRFTDVSSTEIVGVFRQGSDLVLQYGSDDEIVIKYYFSSSAYQIETFEFSDAVTWTREQIARNLAGTEGNDNYSGFSDVVNSIRGLGGNDNLTGGDQADTLDGGWGDDTLSGGAGNDLLAGSVGNDSLLGGTGNDTYRLSKGDGADVLYDYSANSGESDLLQFTDVASTEITAVTRSGNDLILRYGATDQVTLQNYFYGTLYQVEAVKFSNGVSWDRAAIATRLTGTEGNDNHSGFSDVVNSIRGLGGNDSLTGGDLADTLDGGLGNDTLTGGAGNDSLVGTVGDDSLLGGTGNDTYLLSKGDGADAIYDYSANSGETDTLQFTNVASTEITAVTRSGNHLILRYGATDQVTLENYFYGSLYQVEAVKFSNEVTWDRAAIATRLAYTEGNDNYSGFSDVANSIRGLGGNDNIGGGDLADTLDGGWGDDTLSGGAGNDSLVGTVGDDSLLGGTGNDTYLLSKGDGADIVYDYSANSGETDTLQFTNVASTEITAVTRFGNDLILRYGATDQVTLRSYFSGTLYELEAVKFSNGVTWDRAAIATRLAYTEGNDYYSGFSDVANSIRGLGGNDTISGGSLADTLDGGWGDDTLSGGAGNDSLIGGAGSDSLAGGAGNDTYVFRKGDGRDYINDYNSSGADADTLHFAEHVASDLTTASRSGYDLVLKFGSRDGVTIANYFYNADYKVEQYRFADGRTVQGFAVGADGNDVLVGSDGNDYLYGGAGQDSLYGGKGDDVYAVDHASDAVVENASEGNDTVITQLGYSLENRAHLENLVLTGTAGVNGRGNAADNRLVGNSGANLLEGLDGNDTLDGQGGADTMQGGGGNDTYHIDQAGDSIVELEGAGGGYGGVDTVVSTINYTLGGSLENLVLGGSAAINGTGNALNNTITANAAANVLDGAGGIDTLSYATVNAVGSSGVILNLGAVDASGYATASGGSGADRVRNFENVSGSQYADQLSGNAVDNLLSGNNGNDRLNGAGGKDRLLGGAGNDTLAGGVGNDTLTGGAGQDSFLFDTAPNAATNLDTLADFSVVDDTIRLENAVFKSFVTTGALNADFLRVGAGVTTAADANDHLVYNSSTGALYYDADGSGAASAAVQIATLVGNPLLSSADFWIV